jgi:hypothetical protein
VATNATPAELDAHLDAAGIELFDFVAGCDSGHGAKPGPGMCLAFAAHLGCAPGAVVMVGDSLHDLKAGRAAGMRTVGVLTGLARRDDLLPFADAVLPDIGASAHWLDRVRTGSWRGGEENDTRCRGLAMSAVRRLWSIDAADRAPPARGPPDPRWGDRS